MISQVVTCDVCGQKIEGYALSIRVHVHQPAKELSFWRRFFERPRFSAAPAREFGACVDCARELASVLRARQ